MASDKSRDPGKGMTPIGSRSGEHVQIVSIFLVSWNPLTIKVEQFIE
jgi:hypothetical protein